MHEPVFEFEDEQHLITIEEELNCFTNFDSSLISSADLDANTSTLENNLSENENELEIYSVPHEITFNGWENLTKVCFAFFFIYIIKAKMYREEIKS